MLKGAFDDDFTEPKTVSCDISIDSISLIRINQIEWNKSGTYYINIVYEDY